MCLLGQHFAILGWEFTNHQPCPSSKIPQGNPTLCLQSLMVEQYWLSSAQIANPPKKILKPIATISHKVLRIAVSRSAWVWRSESVRGGKASLLRIVPHFAFRDGRRLTSIRYMLLNRTTAVRIANAFW